MTWVEVFSRPDTLVMLIPIVTIVIGGAIAILKMLIRHRERMAMIEQGMHPDTPMDEPESSPGADMR